MKRNRDDVRQSARRSNNVTQSARINRTKVFATLMLSASIALAVPFTYKVLNADGTPSNFALRVDNAFKAWANITSTTLKLERQETASTQFVWGAGESAIEFNPDVITRSLESDTTTEVQVNPAADNTDGGLLVEAGQRLGLELNAAISGKREITDADKNILRAKYSPNGDLNSDGKVNIDDLEILAVNFGKSAQANQALTGDLNGDGKVDEADQALLEKNYVLADMTPVVPAKPATSPATGTPATPADPAKPATPATSPTSPTPATPTDPTAPTTPEPTPPAK